MRSFAIVICSLLLAAPMSDAPAQSPVAAGSRVRVAGTGLVAPVIGSFQAIRSDSLVVLEDGASAQVWSVPVGGVSRFEISEGWHTRDGVKMLKFGALGAAGGLVLGAAISALLDIGAKANESYDTGLNALLGAAIGGGIGAYYGSTRSVERWRPVALPRRMGLSPAPRGLSIGADF